MLVTTKKLLKEAQKKHYACGQFNIYNLEGAQAVIKAAEYERSPVIIGITKKSINYAGLKELSLIVQYLAKNTYVPVALHLDHGKTIDLIKDCIKLGFTSVMFDGSFYNLETNIKLSRKAAKLAHNKGISIEAELGRLGLCGDKACSFTDPDEVEIFVNETKVDSLAIAVGTSHGAYKFIGKPHLDLKRIELISKKTSVPLVLHGASGISNFLIKKANRYGASFRHTIGISDSLIKKAIQCGICKINIDTDLRLAFIACLRKELNKEKNELDPRKLLKPSYEEITKIVQEKIKLFGSNNKI